MDNKQMASRLRELTKKNNTTIAKMARDIGQGKNILNSLEKQNSSPSIETVEKIADYFNVSIDYLIGRAEQPTKIEQNISHSTLNDKSIGINNVQNIENSLTKELINEFEKLSFKNKSYVMNIIAELNEPIDQNFKMVASPSRPEPPKISKESIEEVKRLMQEIEDEKL